MRRALAASLLFHAALLAALFAWAPSPLPVLPPARMEVVSAESLLPSSSSVPFPSARTNGRVSASGSPAASRPDVPAPRAAEVESAARMEDVLALRRERSSSSRGGAGASLVPEGRDERAEVFERAARGDAPLVPWLGAPGTPGGPAHPDEALDGIGRLGSGEPGDPRIPGFAGIDLDALLGRDSHVAQAKEHADRGQIHPFLFEAKRRMESCWQPNHDDALVLRDPKLVEDPVCAQGFHRRYRVAKVLVIYDAAGSRISLRMIGAPDARQLEARVKRAIDEARIDVRPPPPELLDERGLLRLAWNVYVDDYTGCNLLGSGTSGTREDGLEYVVGVIELEGVF